jgi:hypothetical protein
VKKKELSEYFAKLGKKGGKNRSGTLTPERRREIAKKAAAARWGTKGK